MTQYTGGQSQRLGMPDKPPLSDIYAELLQAADKLEKAGVVGFFIAFNYRDGARLLRTSYLHQSDLTLPGRLTLVTALQEVVTMKDLLWVTAEHEHLQQPGRFTAPTLYIGAETSHWSRMVNGQWHDVEQYKQRGVVARLFDRIVERMKGK